MPSENENGSGFKASEIFYLLQFVQLYAILHDINVNYVVFALSRVIEKRKKEASNI